MVGINIDSFKLSTAPILACVSRPTSIPGLNLSKFQSIETVYPRRREVYQQPKRAIQKAILFHLPHHIGSLRHPPLQLGRIHMHQLHSTAPPTGTLRSTVKYTCAFAQLPRCTFPSVLVHTPLRVLQNMKRSDNHVPKRVYRICFTIPSI